MAGVVIENAARGCPRLHDIAQCVEQGKRVTLFQGARPALLDRLGGLDIERRKLIRSLGGRPGCRDGVREGLCLHIMIRSIEYQAATALVFPASAKPL